MFYLFCFFDSHHTQHEWSCRQLSQKFANPLLALVLTKKQSLVSFLDILDSSAQFFSMWTHGGHSPLKNTVSALVSEHFTGQKKVPCVAVCMRLLHCFSCGAVFNFEIPQLLKTRISVVFCTHSWKAISRGRSEPIYETYFTCCHSINKWLSNHLYFHFQKPCYSLRRIKKLMGGFMSIHPSDAV